MLLQGEISVTNLKQELGEILPKEDAKDLIDHINAGVLRDRNRSLSVVGNLRGISSRQIARFLMIDRVTVSEYIKKYRRGGINHLFSYSKVHPFKHEQPQYKEALFAILHSPPSSHGSIIPIAVVNTLPTIINKP
jgi:hypothetical protein